MKNTLVYFLVLFVSFAYNYESVKLLSHSVGHTVVALMGDFEEDEKSPESEESKEKTEKLSFFDEFNAQHALLSFHATPGVHGNHQNSDFSSSDYSQVVYSPPETA